MCQDPVTPTKNKYAKRAKISEAKFRQLQPFCPGSELRLDPKPGRTEQKHRQQIGDRDPFPHCPALRSSISFRGEVEVGEKFSGARRIKVKRGRGALGKADVFRIFKRNCGVSTKSCPIAGKLPYR